MPDTIEVPLEGTIFHRGRFIRSLTLRAPTQAEIDRACSVSEEPGPRGLALLSIITGIGPKAFARMSENDLTRLGEAYNAVTGA